MGLPKLICGLPAHDRGLLDEANGLRLNRVLVGDGRIEPTLSGGAEEFSVSVLALELKERLYITAESVDLGARAEAFRLRVLDEDAPFSIDTKDRVRAPRAQPSGLDFSALFSGALRVGLLRFRYSVEADFLSGASDRIDLLSDEGLVFFGNSGAVFLVLHDHEVPLNLRISTSARVIDRSLQRAVELVMT